MIAPSQSNMLLAGTSTSFMKNALVYITVLPLLLSCEQANPIEPNLVEPSLADITYKQIDYGLYSVRHSSGSRFVSKNVSAIAVGEVDSTGFHVRDSISTTFDGKTGTLTADFYAIVPFNLSLVNLRMRTRYHYVSGSWTDYDSTLSTMKYPYPGTETVLVTSRSFFAEDIDVSDSILYGQINDYILEYNLYTHATSQVRVGSYEVPAVLNDRYVFYDHSNWSLYRYDLQTNSGEQFVYHPSGRFMMGLEIYNDALYELLLDNPNVSLLKYSLSGTLLDSIPLGRNLSRLTILDGIAYFQGWIEPSAIYRFDLSAKTFIDEFRAPAWNYEGIRIRKGFVYFSDFDKRAVGRFPLSELFTYGRL